MPNPVFTSVDQYIAIFDDEVKSRLKATREAIKKAAPAAEETISYNIPAFKLNGKPFMYFSGYKAHVSISCYPTQGVYQKFEKELKEYKTSKSTIQFPLSKPLPTDLIEAITKFKVQEVNA